MKSPSLAETVLRNLESERELAKASGNAMRLAFLEAEIEKLKRQIEQAKGREHELS